MNERLYKSSHSQKLNILAIHREYLGNSMKNLVKYYLERVVSEDESVEVWETQFQPLSNSDYSVVVQHQRLNPIHEVRIL